jgi:hypothetical protein
MEQRQFSLRAAYPFGAANGLENEVVSIREMEIEWDLHYSSSLRKGYIVDLFQRHGLFEQFKTDHWPFGNTPGGEREHLRCLRIKARYEDFLAGRSPEPESNEEAEADLRDFLAKNPGCIESGLTLYSGEGRSGVEFTIEDGRIDLLAVDREQRLVVIELKVGRGRNKTIGQLLYYMGWVDNNLANGKACRGIIIAKDIPDDLALAVQRVPGVTLCRYNLSVAVEVVAAKV